MANWTPTPWDTCTPTFTCGPRFPGFTLAGTRERTPTRQLGAAVGDGITAALAAYHDLSA